MISDSTSVLLMPSIIGSTLRIWSVSIIDSGEYKCVPNGEQMLVIVRIYTGSDLSSESRLFSLSKSIARRIFSQNQGNVSDLLTRSRYQSSGSPTRRYHQGKSSSRTHTRSLRLCRSWRPRAFGIAQSESVLQDGNQYASTEVLTCRLRSKVLNPASKLLTSILLVNTDSVFDGDGVSIVAKETSRL